MSSAPPTPPAFSRAPSYLSFVPRRARTGALGASFDNLVALADAQEALAHAARAARPAVWRARGEPAAELASVRECARHAARGAARAGVLAFNIRAGVNLFLLLFRIRRIPRHRRFALIRHAIFGSEAVRFGAMLGTFVGVYKFLLNALPLLVPLPPLALPPAISDDPDDPPGSIVVALPARVRRHSSMRTARLSLSAGAQRATLRTRGRRWHAALAGAVAGAAAVLCEDPKRRAGVGQQVFVRGLQGAWGSWSAKRGIEIPYGEVVLFILCCGQIMYAALMRPDTLDRAYTNWIERASHVPFDAITMNRTVARDRAFDPALMTRLAFLPNTTAKNRLALLALAGTGGAPAAHNVPAPCSGIHSWRDGCGLIPLERMLQVMRFMAPVYGALHVIPAVLFRAAAFRNDPGRVLLRALGGTLRSCTFLGVFVAIYQSIICGKTNLWLLLGGLRARAASAGAKAPLAARLAARVPRGLDEALVGKHIWWALGAAAGTSVLLEERRRRAELALYVLPKALESAWATARGRGLVRSFGASGDAALAAAGVGMVMATYQNDPQHLGGLVRRIIYQFVGPN